MRLVYVEWLDAYGCSPSWSEIKDIKPTPIVCPHMMPDDHEHAEPQGCGEMTIPTVAIQRIADLKQSTEH